MIFLITVTAGTTVYFYFIGTLGKSNLTHLETNVLISGQCFAILGMFDYLSETLKSVPNP